MSDEEFQQQIEDFMAAAEELGLKLDRDLVAVKMRNSKAKAEEHNMTMDEYFEFRLQSFFASGEWTD